MHSVPWQNDGMHQLILLRHAKALPASAGGADHDRPLTDFGQQQAAAIGKAMRKLGLAPEVVLVSSALRTQQTLEALQAADVWEEWPNIDSLPVLYMAPAGLLRDMLHDLQESVRSALVIGHNPGMHELAVSLAGASRPSPELKRIDEGFPTAALAEFLVATPWRRLGAGGATLQRFITPKDVV